MMQQATPITQEILDRVEVIARDLLEERFASDGFIFDPIIVERKIDHYGDEFVDIRIVYDGKSKLLDVSWRLSLVGRIHSELEGGRCLSSEYDWQEFREEVGVGLCAEVRLGLCGGTRLAGGRRFMEPA